LPVAWLALGMSAIWGVRSVGIRSRIHKERTGISTCPLTSRDPARR